MTSPADEQEGVHMHRSLAAAVATLLCTVLGGAVIAGDQPSGPSVADREPWPSEGCGVTAVATETREDSMPVADLTRSWYTHVPPAHDGQTPLPLLIQLHGNGSDATFMASFTGLDAIGDEEGFVTVTPEGRGQVQRWIYEFDERGWDVTPTNPDVLFMGALIDRLGEQLCLDLARVYVTGISNGGQAATALACVLDDRIAAIAPVAGVVDSGDVCNTVRPVPMLAFYGQEDPIALFDGGLAPFVAASPTEVGVPLGDLAMAVAFEGPVTERVAGIAERYGCDPEPSTELVSEHIERIGYACPGGADVALVIATDGGHAWPGAPLPPQIAAVQGQVNMEIDASRMMWDFFAQHPLPRE
jgi:polyhydroxybutyrate depolymerase